MPRDSSNSRAVSSAIPIFDREGVVRCYTPVDPRDFQSFGGMRWGLCGSGYAGRLDGPARNGGRRIYLHRVIMGLEPGDKSYVDHIDSDRLNNRRANLRVVTASQNGQHRRDPNLGYGVSRFRGVTWSRKASKWQAQAQLHGRYHFLGHYDREEEAGAVARAWREANMTHLR